MAAQNITNNYTESFTNTTLIMNEWLVIPDFFNLVLLSMTVYGMYQGIEIQHPLYAVLFADVILPTICSVVTILSFAFISNLKFIVLSNGTTALCLFFHCNCWCVTSIIRYIYILHENWIQKVLPNFKLQCCAALLLPFVMTVCCQMPMVLYGMHLG